MSLGSGVNASVLLVEKSVPKKNIPFFGCEDSSRFNDILGISFTPTNIAWILLIEDVNGFAFDEKLSILLLNLAIEASMN